MSPLCDLYYPSRGVAEGAKAEAGEGGMTERRLRRRTFAVNLVLALEVVRVGGGPVAIQRRSDLLLCHIKSP
jgi:hypothetical protein